MKSKSEFLNEYRNEHPEYKVYLALEAIFQVIGAIVIIFGVVNINNAGRSDKPMYIFITILGAFIFLIGFVFLKLFQNCDHKALVEWEKYIERESITKSANQNQINDGWKCPSCGRMNASYVGTCGCGERKQ